MLEITDACIEVWGADRVGMHLAPACDAHTMGDSDPLATFSYVARELGRRGIAFICAREGQSATRLGPQLKQAFGGVYIANQQLTKAVAQALLDAGDADAVAFGQLFIANPDLPQRLKADAPLNAPVPATFYAQGAQGYTDYPALG
jgi:2,4-dienoyl-CoA reductase-like NADH-dependent reductase (Old Yellow Enzyme family)